MGEEKEEGKNGLFVKRDGCEGGLHRRVGSWVDLEEEEDDEEKEYEKEKW